MKAIKKEMFDRKEVNELFDEMMGKKDSSKEIILPKYINTRNNIRESYRILNLLGTSVPLRRDYPNIADALDEIVDFSNQVKDCFNITNVETEEMYKDFSEEHINIQYRGLKDNPYTKKLIELCSSLKIYKVDIFGENHNFVKQIPGQTMTIFKFSRFDLKQIWDDERTTDAVKEFIISILRKLYNSTFEIYKTITSADVDMDEFSELILSHIDKLKSLPELSRCNNAFKKISGSIDLLKNNFDSYYREGIISGKQNAILMSYIMDVSASTKMDAKLTREFRVIINYLEKLKSDKRVASDERMQGMYKLLSENFAVIEKEYAK